MTMGSRARASLLLETAQPRWPGVSSRGNPVDHSQKPLISFSPFSRSQDRGCLIWTEVRGQIPEWKAQGLLDLVVSISVLLTEGHSDSLPCSVFDV